MTTSNGSRVHLGHLLKVLLQKSPAFPSRKSSSFVAQLSRLRKVENIRNLSLPVLLVLISGCSDNPDINTGDITGSTMNLSLMTTSGTEIPSESLSCNYFQNTGADNTLSLELQYLESADRVSFALFISDPIPAMPFAASAGQQGQFDFEVFFDSVGYRDVLSNGEVEVRLDNLPSPSALSDGDTFMLEGSLLINQFNLEERAATGEAGSGALNLASGSVDIACEVTFQTANVINQ